MLIMLSKRRRITMRDTGQTQKAIDMYQQLLEKLRAWGPKPDEDLRDATCISALLDCPRRPSAPSRTD